MWVALEARSAGIGSELTESVVGWSSEGGGEVLRLWVVERCPYLGTHRPLNQRHRQSPLSVGVQFPVYLAQVCGTISKMRDRETLRAKSRLIHGHGDKTPAESLAEVAEWCREHQVTFDDYGQGDLIESFQNEVADELGFEAARFMPSGAMAQQIALRVWSERVGTSHVGMHPTAHLELHEERGYSHLHGLRATLVGPSQAPLLAEHLKSVPERLAVLLTELPVREAGGQLPTWDELEDLKTAASQLGTAIHLDGARLWECSPGYGRDLSEICAGFDSCYVSFYKGIGALPGAMLLGSNDFIAAASVWQRRSGGNLHTLTPNVASAAMQWRDRLTQMPTYLERARGLAATIEKADGVRVLPDPPQVNMMHVFVDLDPDVAPEARDRVAEDTGLWLFGWVVPADVPGQSRTEVYVGDAAMSVGDDELERALHLLIEYGTKLSG